MPSGFLQADISFPVFKGNESTDQKLSKVQNYLFMLLEQLRYTLANLDTSNWNTSALSDFIDEIRAGIVVADTVISNVVITNVLTADKATIAELTVDQLDTSDKVQKYLAADTTDDNFQRIYNQFHELVTASTDGNDEEKVQATNRNGTPLYWTDATHAAATTDVTSYPVYTYLYSEQIKWKVFFYEYTTGIYAPAMKWGAGAPENASYDSCLMYKIQGAFYIVMTDADGTESTICLTDFVDAKMRRIKTVSIDKTAGEISVLMEGETTAQTLTYTEDDSSMTFTWPDGYSATVSIS